MRKVVLLLGLLSMAALPLVALSSSVPKPPPGWQVNGNRLDCTYKLANFVESVAFVQQLVAPAEVLGHHPDIGIAYDRVSLSLTTHDAGGLTDLDWQLAQEIDAISTQQTPPLSCLQNP